VISLYTTIIRFDVGYHGAFKCVLASTQTRTVLTFAFVRCNLKMIRHDYPNIHRWLRSLYWNYPAFKDTTNFDHIKGGYYSLKKVNASGVVPKGPLPNIIEIQ
jgi:glutathionyl-hydroquinone reductase